MITYDRPLTDDDRQLLRHAILHGDAQTAAGSVRKIHKSWTWEFRSLKAPICYPTKRAALATFATYLIVIRDCEKAENLRARGLPV